MNEHPQQFSTQPSSNTSLQNSRVILERTCKIRPGTNTSRTTQYVSAIPIHGHLVQARKITQVLPCIGTVQGCFAIFHGHCPIVSKRGKRTINFTSFNNPLNRSSIKLLASIKFYISAGTLSGCVISNIVFKFVVGFLESDVNMNTVSSSNRQ